MKDSDVFAITRPNPILMTLYLIRSVLSGPAIFIVLPIHYFRYHSMRYHFDEDGVHMQWGVLFKREVNLTYARIQDIHLTSGPIQRWLGMTDLQIQTASGSASAEMVIEGILEYEALRDFLYRRMRGAREEQGAGGASAGTPSLAADAEVMALLQGICEEMRGARQALEAIAPQGGEDAHV